MTTSFQSRKPECDNHEGKTPLVVCLTHNEFLCVTCIVEKLHDEPDCDIQELRNFESPSKKLLLEFLITNKVYKTKQKHCDECMIHLDQEHEKLTNDVQKEFERIITQVELMKEKCLADLSYSFSQYKNKVENENKRLENYGEKLQSALAALKTGNKENDVNVFAWQNKKRHLDGVLNSSKNAKIHVMNFCLSPTLRDVMFRKNLTLGTFTHLHPA